MKTTNKNIFNQPMFRGTFNQELIGNVFKSIGLKRIPEKTWEGILHYVGFCDLTDIYKDLYNYVVEFRNPDNGEYYKIKIQHSPVIVIEEKR